MKFLCPETGKPIAGRMKRSRAATDCVWFPSLAKEGLGVVRSISNEFCSKVDRTTPSPSFAKEGSQPSLLTRIERLPFPVQQYGNGRRGSIHKRSDEEALRVRAHNVEIP